MILVLYFIISKMFLFFLQFFKNLIYLVFVQIITILNLLNTTTLKDEATGGFDEYVYPKWSVILGWMIFVCCVIPVPLIFVLNYIREYRKIPPQPTVCSLIYSSLFLFLFHEQKKTIPTAANNYQPVPRYLAAFTENNSPAEDWGPKKRANHYGAYAHLNDLPTKAKKKPHYYNPQLSTLTNNSFDVNNVDNPVFYHDFYANNRDENIFSERF